jgi:hypothetical protein
LEAHGEDSTQAAIKVEIASGLMQDIATLRQSL